ncbi:DUF4123 domain-containing protein [Vibrio spartinae]|uniref:DUF4123 domain-containing protein n=1 Tax=Vibrio spartinae TaxID=1918945 RepID=A0ABX6R7P9_9VIBR|nr:DUF4123 domain-containing protein [Vibrio spartinae]QMV17037.1 hypothetical protein Vspart_04463 [Vibrio spartinae]
MLPVIETTQPIYLLLDSAKIDALAKQVALLDAADQVMPLYAGTRLQDVMEVSPLLVQVSSLIPFAKLLDSDENKDGCLILESDAGFDELFRYWQAQIFALSPESPEPMVFRLYDPRIFAAFQKTEHSLEKKRLFGPCRRIWCWNSKETYWENFQTEDTVDREIWQQSPFMMTQAHLDVLFELKIEHFIHQLHQHVQSYFPQLLPPDEVCEDFARFLHQKAGTLGFENPQSIFYFTNIWCYLGGDCLDKTIYPDIAILLTESSQQTPQQRIKTAAQQLADYQPNQTHRVTDYIC